MTDKNLLVITPHRKEPGKQRIAAYCRVSSRSDEQLNSLTTISIFIITSASS